MISIVLSIVSINSSGQGTFQNLDFESADLTPVPAGQGGGDVPLSAALPGWNASIGSTAVTEVLQNNSTLGNASIDILGPDWGFIYPGIIDGNYSVYIQSGGIPGGGPGSGGVNASLWQDGIVPANAQSLQFKAWEDLPPFASFSVTFADNSLTPIAIGSGQSPSGQDYTIYGVNISPYSGQTGQLEFAADFNPNGPSWLLLDDISFSPQAVPEPSPIVLSGIGGLLFGLYRRFAPKRK